MTTHALTIDLEDWHQIFHRRLTGRLVGCDPSLDDAVHALLDMLDEARVKATFFVVGLVADARPEIVREVARRGHEIGSHTHNHALLHSMSQRELRDEMTQTRARLQDLTGQPILGFRAPEFSVGRLDHWCFEVLAEAGFAYDSSVFPIRARYGIPDAPRTPFVLTTPSGPLTEFPLASWDVGGRRVPVAGGTYWRLLPSAVVGRALRDLDRSGTPAVLYFHPYEFTRGFLHLKELALRDALRKEHLKYLVLHNFFTSFISRRLRPVLTDFDFKPLGEIHRSMRASPQTLNAAKAPSAQAD